MKENMGIDEVSAMLGVSLWRVRRLFEDKTLPEPDRVFGKRVIASDLLPRIKAELFARGWIPSLDESSKATLLENGSKMPSPNCREEARDTTDEILDDSEAARFLKMTRARLIRMANREVVPCIRLPDKEVRFLKSDLLEWVIQYRVPTTASPACPPSSDPHCTASQSPAG